MQRPFERNTDSHVVKLVELSGNVSSGNAFNLQTARVRCWKTDQPCRRISDESEGGRRASIEERPARNCSIELCKLHGVAMQQVGASCWLIALITHGKKKIVFVTVARFTKLKKNTGREPKKGGKSLASSFFLHPSSFHFFDFKIDFWAFSMPRFRSVLFPAFSLFWTFLKVFWSFF